MQVLGISRVHTQRGARTATEIESTHIGILLALLVQSTTTFRHRNREHPHFYAVYACLPAKETPSRL
jgi:hypothetical protein